jgi:hypothetical protein
MTAKISPTINNGTRMPVEFFAPYAWAVKATTIIPKPLSPPLDRPRKKAAREARRKFMSMMNLLIRIV